MIVHDAATTFLALYHAMLAWLIVFGVVVGIVGTTAVACVAPAARAVRKRVRRPLWARTRLGALRYARTRVRGSGGRTAPWVHTQPRRYEEAA